MIKKVRMVLASLLMVGAVVATTQPAGAVDLFNGNCNDASAVCKQVSGGSGKASSLVQSIITLLLWLIGIISVIMIIVGGIRYALSGGDSNSINGAKNTILYAVIGLVVAMLAYAIVNWVVGAFAAPPPAQ